MRNARVISIEVRQKAARYRKMKFEARQKTTKTGAISTAIFALVVILFILGQYI